ncbi:glutaminyl-peptide cyclotransferase [Vespula squamosa]|uniref:Glutaminyl-peptide cyclotransferase n=1 Tax=Vespula squamosa TaxID=30214 RepID=A0ABD2B280_VESSQ
MFYFASCVFLIIIVPYITNEIISQNVPFHREKYYHEPLSLTNEQIVTLADMSNITNMEHVLDNICIVRVVGSPQHKKVKDYITKTMSDLNWTVESDIFEDVTPIFGKIQFENIIAKLNPNATRYLSLACHFDSKYTREGDFVGATDSAVPCAQMINIATVMDKHLKSIQNQDVSLMFIFFDGEEAFKSWGPKDSIYGARHLAEKWHNEHTTLIQDINVSELDRMDILVLLDLIGASDPTFYSYFDNTQRWYSLLINLENTLADLRKFENYSYEKSQQKYFQPYSILAHIEDDHIPFLRKNVPILHLIPYPFPIFWHKPGDNRSNIDMKTTENINRILRAFIASYLHINV